MKWLEIKAHNFFEFFRSILSAEPAEDVNYQMICPRCGHVQRKPFGWDYARCDQCCAYVFDDRL